MWLLYWSHQLRDTALLILSSYKYFSSFVLFSPVSGSGLYLTLEHFWDCIVVLVTLLNLHQRNFYLSIVYFMYIARACWLIVKVRLSYSHQLQGQKNTRLVLLSLCIWFMKLSVLQHIFKNSVWSMSQKQFRN